MPVTSRPTLVSRPTRTRAVANAARSATAIVATRTRGPAVARVELEVAEAMAPRLRRAPVAGISNTQIRRSRAEAIITRERSDEVALVLSTLSPHHLYQHFRH